jgi:hypothetical protein
MALPEVRSIALDEMELYLARLHYRISHHFPSDTTKRILESPELEPLLRRAEADIEFLAGVERHMSEVIAAGELMLTLYVSVAGPECKPEAEEAS